jgi:hypothetical protein
MKKIIRWRCALAVTLKMSGLTFSEIAQVLNLKTAAGLPDKNRARNLVGRGRREMLSELKNLE